MNFKCAYLAPFSLFNLGCKLDENNEKNTKNCFKCIKLINLLVKNHHHSQAAQFLYLMNQFDDSNVEIYNFSKFEML
jgi:hypothetical protein